MAYKLYYRFRKRWTYTGNPKQKVFQAAKSGNVVRLDKVLDIAILKTEMPCWERSWEILGTSWERVKCWEQWSKESKVACEQQTHFRSLLLSLRKIATLFFGGREATTGNASAVRRLGARELIAESLTGSAYQLKRSIIKAFLPISLKIGKLSGEEKGRNWRKIIPKKET